MRLFTKKEAIVCGLVLSFAVFMLTPQAEAGVGKVLALVEDVIVAKFGGEVSEAAPADGEVLTWSDSNNAWGAAAAGGATPTLSAVLAAGATMDANITASDTYVFLGDVDTDPFYSFSGDTDTGLGADAANEPFLMAAGTKYLYIDPSEAYTAWNATVIKSGSTGRLLVRQDSTGMMFLGNGGSRDHEWATNAKNMASDVAIYWSSDSNATGTKDLRIQRSAAKTVQIDDASGGAATLSVVGNISGTEELGSGELSADPSNPAEGNWVLWQSDGTGSGDDGDLMLKITAASTTKTITLVDWSTF